MVKNYAGMPLIGSVVNFASSRCRILRISGGLSLKTCQKGMYDEKRKYRKMFVGDHRLV